MGSEPDTRYPGPRTDIDHDPVAIESARSSHMVEQLIRVPGTEAVVGRGRTQRDGAPR